MASFTYVQRIGLASGDNIAKAKAPKCDELFFLHKIHLDDEYGRCHVACIYNNRRETALDWTKWPPPK